MTCGCFALFPLLSLPPVQVRVGSMCDPAELPGLAHFCEHMLFYSSEKYPVEDEYSRWGRANHLQHVRCGQQQQQQKGRRSLRGSSEAGAAVAVVAVAMAPKQQPCNTSAVPARCILWLQCMHGRGFPFTLLWVFRAAKAGS